MQRVLLVLLVLLLAAGGVGLFLVLQPTSAPPAQATPTSAAPAADPTPAPDVALATPDEVAQSPAASEPAVPASPTAPVEAQAGRTEAQEFARIQGSVQLPEDTPADEQLSVRLMAAESQEGSDFPLITTAEDHEVLAESEVDRSGRFELSVPLDKQSVWLELDANYLFLEQPLEVTLEAQTSVTVRPRLGAWISGRLITPDDASAEELEDVGERVSLRPDRMRNAGAMGIGRGGVRRRSTEADEDLEFSFTGVKTGPQYNLHTAPDRLTAAKSEALEPAPGQHLIVDLMLTRGGRLSGRVVDSGGKPVAEAELELTQDPMIFGQGGFDVRDGESDDTGAFDLQGIRPGVTTVKVSADGFIETSLKLEFVEGQHLGDQTVTLEAGNRISGRVLWEDRSPAANVEVGLRFDLAFLGGMEAFNAMKGAEGEAVTDEQGNFAITGLGKGPFTVMATAENEDDPAVGLAGIRPEWRGRVDGVRPGAEVELILGPPIGIDGVVVNDLGEPVTEFRVSARQDTGGMLGGLGAESESGSFTDDQGRFHLDGLREGEWLVGASAEGYGRPEPVAVTAPQVEGAQLEVVLPRAASVLGTVLDPDGQPAAGATVGRKFTLADIGTLGSQGGEPPTAVCDEEGHFELTGLTPGSFSLVAHAEALADSAPVPVELTAAQQLEDVVLELRIGGRILGEVLDDEGKPSAGRTIIAQVTTDPGNQRFANSDLNGEFVIESLSPGNYQVMTFGSSEDDGSPGQVEEDNFAEFFSDMKMTMAEVVDGEDTFVTLGSKAGDPVIISGRVVSDGKPVGGLLVSFFNDGEKLLDGMKFSNTKGDGTFEMKLSQPGRYLVNVQKVTGTGMQQNVEFSRTVPEVERHDMVLDLPISGISGTVYAPDRKPAAGMRISLSVDGPIRNGSFTGGNYAEIQTDEDGRYELLWLRPGTYTVAAGGTPLMSMFGGATGTGPGRQVQSGLKVKDGQRLTDIDFRLQDPGVLSGQVLDLAGRPVAEAAIFLRDGKGNALDRFSFVATDAAGKFDYPGLEPGDYLVTARAAGTVSTEAASANVRSGQKSEVQLTVDAGTLLIVSLSDKEGNPVECSVEVLDSEGHQVNGMWSMSELMAAFSQGGFSSLEQKVGPLPPGKYRVKATSTGGLSANKPVTLRSSMETRKLSLRLD